MWRLLFKRLNLWPVYLIGLLIGLVLILPGVNGSSISVANAADSEASGAYTITPVTRFSSDFGVSVQNLTEGNFYAVYRNDTIIGSVVPIADKVRSIPQMFSDPTILEIRFYNDSTGLNQIAAATLTSNQSLLFKTVSQDHCFIATAAFGSKFEPSVVLLREFRDKCLLSNSLGRLFVRFYYHYSPPLAKVIAGSEFLKSIVRILLIPLIILSYLCLHSIWILLLGMIGAGLFICRKKNRSALVMPLILLFFFVSINTPIANAATININDVNDNSLLIGTDLYSLNSNNLTDENINISLTKLNQVYFKIGGYWYDVLAAKSDAEIGVPANALSSSIVTGWTGLDIWYKAGNEIVSADVEADKNALELGYTVPDSQSSVTQNINLPLTGVNGSEITWSSNNEGAITNSGIVTRTAADQIVTLTATIIKGPASAAKIFTVTVKAAVVSNNYGRSYPVMAYDPENNRYLMVYFKHDIDARDYNLYGRLLAANGDYIGEEFSILTSRDVGDSFDFRPDVAYDSADKKFLVVWNEISSPEDMYWDIYGQILNPDGSKSGEPFAISDSNDGKRQTKPFVAYDNVDNKFLVAYRHDVDSNQQNQQQDDIHGRFVSIAGSSPALLGTDFLIAGGDWCQDLTDVVFNDTNEFMLPISSYQDNRFVAVDATGIARNAYSLSNTAFRPSLAFDNVNNRFLAAWFSVNRIYGVFLKQDGSADGAVFQVSDSMFEPYGNVSVSFAEGSFYVAWQEEVYDAYYNSYINIAAKKIEAITGQAPNQIDITTGANNAHSPFVCGSNNGALVAWTAENGPAVIGLQHLAGSAAPAAPASFTAAPQAADITLSAPITVNLSVDKAATAYYAVVQEDNLGFETPAPTAEQLKELICPEGGWYDSYGVVPVMAAGCEMLSGQTAEQTVIPTTNGFNAMRTYTVYSVLETDTGVFSEVASAAFNTLADNNPPLFNTQSGTRTGVWGTNARSLIIAEETIDYDEKYDLYIWAVKSSDAPLAIPSAPDVKANGKLYEELTSGVSHIFTYTGLDPGTEYKVYMVAQDYSGEIEGLYSDVLADMGTTLADNEGPDQAGTLNDADCYVFKNDGAIRNKYLEIQFNEGLYNEGTPEFFASLAGKIRIYDYPDEKTLAERGDTIGINGDTMTITFAVPPTEAFQLYINSGALQDTNTSPHTNQYEISISVDVPDITPAEFETGYPKGYAAGIGSQSIAAEVCFNEDVAVFWALLPANSAEPLYNNSIVDRSMLNAIKYGSLSIEALKPTAISITGLESSTTYDLWITAIDGNNNYLNKQKITLTTPAD